MDPIRILHIVTYMGRGGLETMIMNYYRHIDRSKIQFDFLVHRDFEADYDAEIRTLGGKIYHLPPLNPFSNAYLSCLDHFFVSHKEYRIVHSHLDCMAGIPLKYAKKHGVPVRIAHAHNSNQIKDAKYLLKLFFKRSIPHHATHLYACSRDAGRWMFQREDFQILNNAIDAASYTYAPQVRAEIRQELGLAANTLLIGHVGRFMAQKNHAFLLRILSYLPKDARLLLVGDGELRQSIERQADALGIRNRIIFTGVRSDVNRLLQAMDVFVFPSHFEGLPVTLVEAQASGLPCIISDSIPTDCNLTPLITSVSLTEPAEKWASLVLQHSDDSRKDTYNQIESAGFDISHNALWLQNEYIYYLTKQKAG